MRKLVFVAVVLVAACASHSTSPATDGAAYDGTGNDGNATTDAHSDAGATADASYAPCPTCCDPILQNCTNTGDACYPVNPLGGLMTSCLPSGTKLPGFTCARHQTSSECVSGSQCGPSSDGAGGFICTKLCASDTDCSTGQICRVYDTLAYGYCTNF